MINFTDKLFVEIDVLLRRGGHINRSNIILYQYLCENNISLKPFYDAYECQLVQHQDGFFFLLPKGSIIKTRVLSKPCMHLGMFLALKMRDPEITRTSGKLHLNQLLQAIDTSVSREVLQNIYAPKQRESSTDTKVADEIKKALRTLAELNFLQIQGDVIIPAESIHRFAELARHNNNPDDITRASLKFQRGVVFDKIESNEDLEDDGGNNERLD